MLNSAVQVVSEAGYGQMSVARVTGRAGVSRRTFYELFEDREACFIAAFDQAVGEMSQIAACEWGGQDCWTEQVRAALGALLAFLDEQPALGMLVVVGALGAGPRVLAHRARLLARLAEIVDLAREQPGRLSKPPPLTAEGVVGAVLSVVHARLLSEPRTALAVLLSPLMSIIVAPYLGSDAAARELRRPAPARSRAHSSAPRVGDPLGDLPMRVTRRTLLVLAAIHEHPGASNRQIAGHAGVTDQGQISKLLTRLQRLGLIENSGVGPSNGEPNAWHLTPRGAQVQQATGTQTGNGRARSAVEGATS